MTGILAIWNDYLTEHAADFEAWYLREHFPERLAVPGFRSGRRYERTNGSPRYFCYYEVDDPAVLASPAYQQRLQNPTPWTLRVMQNGFRNMTRTACVRTAAFGTASGAHAVTARWAQPDGDAAALAEFAERLTQRGGVTGTQVWAASGPPASETTESRARGGDTEIGGAMLIDCARAADAEAVASALRSAGLPGIAEPVIATYAFLYRQDARPA